MANINEILDALVYGSTKKTLEDVEYALKSRDNTIQQLREENERLKNQHYEESELKKMKSKYDVLVQDSRRGFTISKEEENKINTWINEHQKKKHNGFSIGNGQYEYRFQCFDIVETGSVVCTICGESFTFQNK